MFPNFENGIQIGRFKVVSIYGLIEGVFATDGKTVKHLTLNPRIDYSEDWLEDIFR